MIMRKIPGNTVIKAEDVKVLYKDHYLHFIIDDEPMSLEDVLEKIQYDGGVVMVITESFMSGAIFRYGNYNDDYWYKVGEMVGFA